MRILLLFAVFVLTGLANLALWSLPNRPVMLEPPSGGKLRSVSFAPFRDGQSPMNKTFPTPAQIEEDLAAIAPQVAGVRTYTSLEGLEVVPELARRHGMTVTLGAWLSPKLDQNEKEIASLIDLANRYPDTVTRVIVGNEVLLRRDLTPEQIAGYLRRVKAAIKQPVSYADVWEYWLKYPEMAQEVDYITIHLLPYWEDIPASIEKGAEHVGWSYREIARRFPGKPILVGEVGWPTAGRARGPSATGIVAQARFINAFVHHAERDGFDYNLIEAFDQNWKQKLEGTVGGRWGLYTADRQAKYPLGGPVVENPRWPFHAAVSTIGGFALIGLLLAAGPPLPASRILMLALLTQGAVSAWVHAAAVEIGWSYLWQDVVLAWIMLPLLTLLVVAVPMAARRSLAGGGFCGAETRVGDWVVRALAAVAVAWSLLIVFDGRYRDVPVADYLLPALALPLLGWIAAMSRPAGLGRGAAFAAGALFRPALAGGAACGWRWDAWTARLLILGGVLTILAEGILPVGALVRGLLKGTTAAPLSAIEWTNPNLEALTWAALLFLLAVPFAVAARVARRAASTPPLPG